LEFINARKPHRRRRCETTATHGDRLSKYSKIGGNVPQVSVDYSVGGGINRKNCLQKNLKTNRRFFMVNPFKALTDIVILDLCNLNFLYFKFIAWILIFSD
jgi:hypothetical protein